MVNGIHGTPYIAAPWILWVLMYLGHADPPMDSEVQRAIFSDKAMDGKLAN